jgi:hypothetical protein
VNPALLRRTNIHAIAVRLDKLARNFLATVLLAYESAT